MKEQKGEQKEEQKLLLKMVESMLMDGKTVEEIVNFCEIPQDFVRKVKEEMSVTV